MEIIKHFALNFSKKVAKHLLRELAKKNYKRQIKQLPQDILSLQLELSDIQAKIRILEGQEIDHIIKKNLTGLRVQESNIIRKIENNQSLLKSYLKHQKIPETIKPLLLKPKPFLSKAKAVKSIISRDWLVTLLLNVFLGFWGVHRFYTGHIIIGIIQFFTFGGFGLWWFIDFVLIITNQYRDANGSVLLNPIL